MGRVGGGVGVGVGAGGWCVGVGVGGSVGLGRGGGGSGSGSRRVVCGWECGFGCGCAGINVGLVWVRACGKERVQSIAHSGHKKSHTKGQKPVLDVHKLSHP